MKTPAHYLKASKHLRRDMVLGPHVLKHGHCTLEPKPEDPFTMLVRCVVGQQLSTKAASTIYAKLLAAVEKMTPSHIAAASEEAIRAAGLSGSKQKAIRAIAEHVTVNREFLKSLPTLDDDAFRAAVCSIHGIGPWSADMMLMFGYGRLDVLPVGDFGVRAAVQTLYGLDALPTPAQLTTIAEPWRPYRSVASWYLWRIRDTK
jgi:DNA-3-methyladenine glycosylase II